MNKINIYDYDIIRYIYESEDRRGRPRNLSYRHSLIRSMLHCIVNDRDIGFEIACRDYEKEIENEYKSY